ncbi:MAG: hypothetical protein WCS98_08475 [Bacillota bacterium]|nr:hypothetical protein [Bacillota bacterium]MDD3851683.1 hypothetical protein [Bacillota bacterium]
MKQIIVYTLITALLLITVSVAIAAPIQPEYIPLECDLTPEKQYVSDMMPYASFEGTWARGQTSTYHIDMNYDDGNRENYYTTDTFGVYRHNYNLAYKPIGYKWYPRLTVTNGIAEYDEVIVEVN